MMIMDNDDAISPENEVAMVERGRAVIFPSLHSVFVFVGGESHSFWACNRKSFFFEQKVLVKISAFVSCAFYSKRLEHKTLIQQALISIFLFNVTITLFLATSTSICHLQILDLFLFITCLNYFIWRYLITRVSSISTYLYSKPHRLSHYYRTLCSYRS